MRLEIESFMSTVFTHQYIFGHLPKKVGFSRQFLPRHATHVLVHFVIWGHKQHLLDRKDTLNWQRYGNSPMKTIKIYHVSTYYKSNKKAKERESLIHSLITNNYHISHIDRNIKLIFFIVMSQSSRNSICV